MKFFKYSLIAALALSGALCACDDDNDYAPGAAVSGDEVFFPINESATVDIPTDATSVAVTVNRLNADDAVSVPVAAVITDSEGADATDVFTVPSQVTFAAGEKETELTIGVDFAKVTPDEEYEVTLTLEGDNTTPYGASTRTYTLVYAPWTEWDYVPGEEGVYTMSVYKSAVYEVPVLFRKSLVNPNKVEYAVCDLLYVGKEAPYINFTYSMDLSNTIEVDGVDCPIVTMSPLNCGENGAGTGNYLMLYDYRTWSIEIFGVSEENVDAFMERNSISQSYYNPETGTFVMSLILIGTKLEPGSYYSDGFDYLQLPGYKSYVLNFEYTGNYFDPFTETEYAIVNAYKSEDVASYVYDIFAGALDGDDLVAAVEDVKANEEIEAVTAETSNLAFDLKEDGKYTVVGIGLDENGEEVCSEAYVFNFKSVRGGAVEEWNSLGFCEYTDVVIPDFLKLPNNTFDVEIQENADTPGMYRLVDTYKKMAEAYARAGMTYEKGINYLTIDATDPDQVFIPTTLLGIGYGNYGQFIISSYAYMLMTDYGVDASAIAAKGYFGKLKDGVITFPAGCVLDGLQGVKDGVLMFANLDPENPTLADDYEGDFDPFYGEGFFEIVLPESVTEAPAKANKFAPINYLSVKSTKGFESGFKFTKSSTALKTVDAETLNEYRLANPRTVNF